MLENLAATSGLIFSGQLLIALTQKDVSRETAYEWTQRNAMRVWDDGKDFRTLVSADPDISARLTAAEIDQVFSLDRYLKNVDVVFRRVFGGGSAATP